MAAVTLSYAQALRVIGQNLIPLGIDSFELAKWGDDYIVWEHGGCATYQRNEFFAKITERLSDMLIQKEKFRIVSILVTSRFSTRIWSTNRNEASR
jgi:hypothetical protein